MYPAATTSVGISVLYADTDEEADRLALSREFWAMKLRTSGEPGPIPPVAEALAYEYEPREQASMKALRRRAVVGSPQTVRDGLLRHAADYNIDEFLCFTITYDFAARKRSYELLAEAFGLKAPA